MVCNSIQSFQRVYIVVLSWVLTLCLSDAYCCPLRSETSRLARRRRSNVHRNTRSGPVGISSGFHGGQSHCCGKTMCVLRCTVEYSMTPGQNQHTLTPRCVPNLRLWWLHLRGYSGLPLAITRTRTLWNMISRKRWVQMFTRKYLENGKLLVLQLLRVISVFWRCCRWGVLIAAVMGMYSVF